jgi:hypothetical protein
MLMLAACSPADQMTSQLGECQREALRTSPDDWVRPDTLAAFATEICMRNAGYSYGAANPGLCSATRPECYRPATLRRRLGL